MFAIALSLLTAFSFASASLFAQRGLHRLSTPWGVWITLIANCIFLWGLHLLFHPEAPILIKANLPFVVIGLFVPGLARMLIFRGIRKIGSSMTATVESSTPMFSTILAIIFLRERPGLLVLSGIGMIVVGLMVLSWVREERSWSRAELLFPLSAAFLFGLKDVLARWGLAMTGQPILAAAITVTAATLEVFLIVRCVHGERFSLPPLRVIRWFVISGLFTGCAFLFMFSALH
ncbi:MAG: DMT family transporter, partial [Candidatus Binatia bacterium]